MIKSKLDARERALELAVKCFDAKSQFGTKNVISFAEAFEKYLIGYAELPEFVSNVDDMLEAVEILKKQMPEFSKTENGGMEFLLPAPKTYKLINEEETDSMKTILTARGYVDVSANLPFWGGDNYRKSFGKYDLNFYICKRVGGYIASPSVIIGDGADAYHFTIPDYNLDIDRIEGAALKHYECHCETIGVDEGA